MKKSLIALAVLAASGAAMAQSSVTVYGVVDAAVAHTSKTDAAGVSSNQNVVASSGANNSRWGLKGSEDLGGGLKANFVLESGFDTDTGAANGAQFGRQAFVGIEGGFGSVTLGRQYTAYFTLYSATNNLYDTNLATTGSPLTGSVWGAGVPNHSFRSDNSIAYTSPVISGFSGAAVVGLGENKVAAAPASATAVAQPAVDSTRNYSLQLKYANGPLLVGYAYQVESNRTAAVALPGTVAAPAAPAANKGDQRYNLLAGSYDFGVAKLTAGFNVAKQDAKKDKEFQIGVSVPFGAAAVAAGYSYSKGETSGTTTTKASGLSLLGTYSLSKRTTLYAGLAGTNFEDGTGKTTSKNSVVAAGIRHTF